MDASSSLADISLLLLADAAVPQYASAIVAALISINQNLKSQVDTITADVRSIRESIEELKEMKREERKEDDKHRQNLENERNAEQSHNDAPNKRDLAFSVYLRDLKSEEGDHHQRQEEEEEEEYDDDEMNDEDDEEDEQPGTSSAAAAANHLLLQQSQQHHQTDFSAVAAALSLMNSLPGFAQHQFSIHPPTTVSSSQLQQEQPYSSTSAAAAGAAREESATPGSSKRIILPCPRSGCEVLLYSQLGFSAHLRIHDGKMPFECTNCGREFRLRDGLVKHMRTHTGERPYPCQVCGKNFKRIHHRKKHLQQHIGSGSETPTVPPHGFANMKLILLLVHFSIISSKPLKETWRDYNAYFALPIQHGEWSEEFGAVVKKFDHDFSTNCRSIPGENDSEIIKRCNKYDELLSHKPLHVALNPFYVDNSSISRLPSVLSQLSRKLCPLEQQFAPVTSFGVQIDAPYIAVAQAQLHSDYTRIISDTLSIHGFPFQSSNWMPTIPFLYTNMKAEDLSEEIEETPLSLKSYVKIRQELMICRYNESTYKVGRCDAIASIPLKCQ